MREAASDLVLDYETELRNFVRLYEVKLKGKYGKGNAHGLMFYERDRLPEIVKAMVLTFLRGDLFETAVYALALYAQEKPIGSFRPMILRAVSKYVMDRVVQVISEEQ